MKIGRTVEPVPVLENHLVKKNVSQNYFRLKLINRRGKSRPEGGEGLEGDEAVRRERK
jgi:hypothetical protein